jgi:hypothetical protein
MKKITKTQDFTLERKLKKTFGNSIKVSADSKTMTLRVEILRTLASLTSKRAKILRFTQKHAC